MVSYIFTYFCCLLRERYDTHLFCVSYGTSMFYCQRENVILTWKVFTSMVPGLVFGDSIAYLLQERFLLQSLRLVWYVKIDNSNP
jgi:hypothetical protein